MTHKMGCKYSEQLSSDKSFSKVESQLTKLASASSYGDYVIPEYTPISSQGKLSSCVGNGLGDLYEILMGIKDPNNVKQLSRLFIYWNARVIDRSTDKDEGTHIRNAMSSLITTGVCLESMWTYDESKVFVQPNLFCYSQASDNKLSDFYRIINSGNEKLDMIESAIRSNHPVIFGAPVSREFADTYDVGQYPIFDFPKSSIGRHCMLIVGIIYKNNKRHFLIRNSWGKYWGDGSGRALLTENYLKDEEVNDMWVGTNMPDLLI